MLFSCNSCKNSQGKTANRMYAVLLGSCTQRPEILRVIWHQRVKLVYNKYSLESQARLINFSEIDTTLRNWIKWDAQMKSGPC
jgi:hypothetical protein